MESQKTDAVIAGFCKEQDWFAVYGGEICLTPKLRFKEFDGDWSKKRLDSFLEAASNPVVDAQNYVQIGIRSHGKKVFFIKNQ